MTLKLKYIPDPILKQVSSPVDKVDSEVLDFMDEMLETMYQQDGIGLAGIQVGYPKRVVVIDLRDKNIESEDEEKKKNPRFFINPKITWRSDNKTPLEEGCLSIPNQRAVINRPQKIKVQYLNKQGKEEILEADGLLSKCIQHEIDHLNGKLFTDYLSKLKRDLAISRVEKTRKLEKVK